MLEYKGYLGKVEFDDEAELFCGEVISIRDVITFQGKSVAELTKAFRASVDDYLAFCQERGEDPEKPFSGQFVTRIPPELHREINVAALMTGKSLNTWVTEQLQNAVERVAAMKNTGRKLIGKKKSTSSRALPKRKSPKQA